MKSPVAPDAAAVTARSRASGATTGVACAVAKREGEVTGSVVGVGVAATGAASVAVSFPASESLTLSTAADGAQPLRPDEVRAQAGTSRTVRREAQSPPYMPAKPA
ncbi:hypothetical protein EES44_05210 [Streptomyces sp. ADI96-15]|nr:hypothetical protein EES44_05210 [Streptomyces sp. ADI96-15]